MPTHRSPVLESNENVRLIVARKEGLFSLVFQVLGHIAICEKTGQIPLVYFNNTCTYWTDEGWHDSRNVWEYYFEPVSLHTIHELLPIPSPDFEAFGIGQFRSSAYVVNTEVVDDYPDVVAYVWPDQIDRQRVYVHELIKRHIRLKPWILSKLDYLANELFHARPVIAVHYRGREKLSDGTSILRLKYEDYYCAIEQQLNMIPTAGIFVATDSDHFLTAVSRRFGDRVVSANALRLTAADEHIGLHFHRDFQGPRIGEEVLIDALLLARSDILLHGTSNVATAALYFNPALPHLNLEWRKAIAQRLCRSLARLGRPFMPDCLRHYIWRHYLRVFK